MAVPAQWCWRGPTTTADGRDVLAAAKNAPLLFVQGSSLTPETQAGIVRVLPAHGTVYLLGGTAAIPDSVATTLTGLGFDVVRYADTDRYDTP